MSDAPTSPLRLSPAGRSALIIGGGLSIFILMSAYGVMKEARRIAKEKELTRALNNHTSSGEMIWIPAGKMTMGAQDGAPDEQPLHDVKIKGFWLDKTQVTNEQFTRFVKATGYITAAERNPSAGVVTANPEHNQPGAMVFFPPATTTTAGSIWRFVPGANWQHPEGPSSTIAGREKYPVVQISWEDAAAFARWAGKRLPTEAEYEYAARAGGMHFPYVWGRELTPGGHWWANVWQGRFPVENTKADGFTGLAPVGQYQNNDYGLSDMTGNVWEWCADWYRVDYYVKSPHADPPGPETGIDPDEPTVPKRVARGGSYLSSETNGAGYRVAARRKIEPGFASCELGFRCARSIQ